MREDRFLCRLDELEDPGSRGFDGREVGVPWDFFVVRSNGAVVGFRNCCPHTGAPLDWTPHRFLDPDREFIQCSMHGALFRLEDGECLHGPCVGRALEAVALHLEEGWVVMGEVKS